MNGKITFYNGEGHLLSILDMDELFVYPNMNETVSLTTLNEDVVTGVVYRVEHKINLLAETNSLDIYIAQ